MQLDEHSRKIAALVAYNDKQIKEKEQVAIRQIKKICFMATFLV